MKKIYISMIALMFSAGAFAQIPVLQKINLMAPNAIPPAKHSSAETAGYCGTHLWLEYDSADAFINGTPQAHTLQWPMNKRYSLAAGDNSLYLFQTCIVRFDSLWDLYTSPSTGTAINNDTVTTITVDSIYAVVGHQNVSGTNDTLIAKIINLDASGYPGSTTLWSDTLVIDSSLSKGSWRLVPVQLQWNPGYIHAMKNFAVELDYYGSKLDTLSLVDGFNDLGSCAGASCPTCLCTHRANYSNFYPNSYAAWVSYVSSYPLLPAEDGSDIFAPCDGGTTFNATCDGLNYLQDFIMGAYITINSCTTGIQEDLKTTGIGLYQNVPNPLNSTTDIKYEIGSNAKNVTLYVNDIVGHQVMEVNEGNRSPGKYTIQLDASKLAKGMYTYTLRADGSQLTKRMIVE